MIRFTCPGCGRRFKADPSRAGKKARCPTCQSAITVPSAEAPQPVPSSAGAGVRRSVPPAEHHAHEAEPDGPLFSSGHTMELGEEMIDMTAMVDIVFFLLIFFMVTGLNVHQAAIAMPAPPPAAPTAGTLVSTTQPQSVEEYEQDEDFIVIRIDADNAVWVDDEETDSPQSIVAKLRDAMDNAPGGGTRKVLVVGNPDAQNGTAVMVLDAVHEVGVEDVRLAVVAEEE